MPDMYTGNPKQSTGNIMKLTLKAHALHTVMSDALAFAGTDATIPALNGIRLETVQRDETVDLLAIATDRFTLGVSRADASGDILPEFNISVADAKNLVRIAKTVARMQTYRTVDIESGDDGYSVNATFTFSSGESVTVRKHEHDFPRWRQLVPAEIGNREYGSPKLATIDPMKFAQFSKVVAAKRNPARMYQTMANKRIVITVGDDFIGLLMPHRESTDAAYSLPVWF